MILQNTLRIRARLRQGAPESEKRTAGAPGTVSSGDAGRRKGKSIRKTAAFPSRADQIGEATRFVGDCRRAYGVKTKEAVKATLVTEEAIGSLVSHAAEDGTGR